MEDIEAPERYPVGGTPFMVERLSRGRWGAAHSAGMPCGHGEWTDPMRAASSLLTWWISLSDDEQKAVNSAAYAGQAVVMTAELKDKVKKLLASADHKTLLTS